jgi:putative SOS response-associated peptidase YedK
MCGRFGYTLINLKDGTQKWIRLVQELSEPELNKIDALFRILENKDAHPGGTALILYQSNQKLQIEDAIWGVKPDWSPKVIFNTRVEKLFHSSFWGKIAFTQRCLIPASYFFEWKSESGTKVRYRIENADQRPFSFAGIWGKSETKTVGQPSFWFTILTQEGNSLMKEIHNTGGNQGRQPVQIKDSDVESWLDPRLTNQLKIEKLITHYESESIHAIAEPEQPLLF